MREKKGVLLVKTTVVRTIGSRSFVQVVQDGRRRDVDVEVGVITPTETEIVAGVKEGDKIADLTPGVPTPGPTPARKP
jgi:macrolide-specific efflux system membrane fusion protein